MPAAEQVTGLGVKGLVMRSQCIRTEQGRRVFNARRHDSGLEPTLKPRFEGREMSCTATRVQ